MANEEHLAILRQGVDVWNQWRKENRQVTVDLYKANLEGANLEGANLEGANLQEANLLRANLEEANLEEANLLRAGLVRTKLYKAKLCKAKLYNANLVRANLEEADLEEADLEGATLYKATLSRAKLYKANLNGTNLERADLEEANLEEAILNGANLNGANLVLASLQGGQVADTVFANLDLRNVFGLGVMNHRGPSTVGIDTIYRSAGRIPEAFLRGCGVPDALIDYLPSLIGAMQPVQYYSCFISYSIHDDIFARRLYDRMRGDHLRVWFAPEELKGGEKLFDQIDQAIRVYDKLVLVLSEASMASSWVQTELRRARAQEQRGGKRKLFPIRLVSMEQLQAWELFDSDAGTDLAVEVRSYFIPDFSNWKDHDAFEDAYARLLRDLKAAA